jgi:acetylglutamate/LysW-gamma-L-alpha-aminoadipate kinase
MFRKLTAAAEALRGGVPAVRISDGRTDAPITAAIGGAGTALALGQQERA